MTIYPVILPILNNKVSGKESINRQRKTALDALNISAKKNNILLGELKKAENGAPLPFEGNYWSISHKPSCVAAVISKKCIGIDIEQIKERPASIMDYVISQEEWDLIGEKIWKNFYRIWTAKEASLKLTGVGISDLSKCRAKYIPDDYHIELLYKSNIIEVEQFYYNNHIISVIKNGLELEWVTPD